MDTVTSAQMAGTPRTIMALLAATATVAANAGAVTAARPGGPGASSGGIDVKAVVIVALLAVVITAMGAAAWRMRDRLGILGEFLQFLVERKLWWMVPLTLVFVFAGLFVVVLGKSGVAAMIYPLF